MTSINPPSSTIVFATLAALLATAAHAQTPAQPKMDHSKMRHSKIPPLQAEADPPQEAQQAANDRMHKDMGIAFTGDADKDFLAGMIPHHQGAIDMAKVVLQHGKDAKVKKLARDIIKAQEREIAMMKTWLAKKK